MRPSGRCSPGGGARLIHPVFSEGTYFCRCPGIGDGPDEAPLRRLELAAVAHAIAIRPAEETFFRAESGKRLLHTQYPEPDEAERNIRKARLRRRAFSRSPGAYCWKGKRRWEKNAAKMTGYRRFRR